MTRPTDRGRAVGLTLGAVFALLTALLVSSLAFAPRAEAYIYWTNFQGIGRANLDGTGVDETFVASANNSGDIAVDGEHIYWTGPSGISRAKLDGTDVEPSFIPWVSEGPLQSVEVDAGHLYWSYYACPAYPCTGAIARANLDGTGVDRTFIGGVVPAGLAVDTNFVYFVHRTNRNPDSGTNPDTIGRANLDGTGVDTDLFTPPSIIPIVDRLGDIAVDSSHIYWTRASASLVGAAVGRANLDGTGVVRKFLTENTGGISVDIAVDASHVYWSSPRFFFQTNDPAIGRANLDGTGVEETFIEGTVVSVAVDSVTDTKLAGKASAVRIQRQTGKRIVVKAKVKAKEQLTAEATGKVKVNPTYKLRPKQVQVAAGKTRTLRLKPKKAHAQRIAAALNRGEKATARLSVKLTDSAGNRQSERFTVRLKQ